MASVRSGLRSFTGLDSQVALRSPANRRVDALIDMLSLCKHPISCGEHISLAGNPNI